MLSMADFRAARRGFWATALSFAAIGLVLGTMTTWPLSARVIICAVFMAVAGGGLIWILDYLKVREALGIENSQTDTGRLVSQAQFEKVRELERFLGGKDENDLRNLFDLNTILERNIAVQATRIRMLQAGHYEDFLYKNPMLFWAKEGYYTAGPNGVHVNNGPRDVFFLEITQQYEDASKKLTEFQNTALIPSPIENALADFKVVLGQYTDTMFRVLDEMACTRFRRHRVRCFTGTGGGSWRGGSLRGSSSLRLCG